MLSSGGYSSLLSSLPPLTQRDAVASPGVGGQGPSRHPPAVGTPMPANWTYARGPVDLLETGAGALGSAAAALKLKEGNVDRTVDSA